MMAFMLHPINGRVAFDNYQASEAARAAVTAPSAGLRVTSALVIAMLRRENELRLTQDVSVVFWSLILLYDSGVIRMHTRSNAVSVLLDMG